MHGDRMNSSGKLNALDASGGADFYTVTAVGALFVVNDSQIVNDLNSTGGTLLLTLLAADTADLASLTSDSTLFQTTAANDGGDSFRNDVDQVVGASLCTNAAAYAVLGIDSSQTVMDMDRIVRTNRNTVTITEAVKGTA